MQTKIIEVTNGRAGDYFNWGKFLVGRFDQEWQRPSVTSGLPENYPLLGQVGWTHQHLLVLDLQTGEGAIFYPGGLAEADLQEKHRIWTCPLFQPFLEWFYDQPPYDLDRLPDHVHLPQAPSSMVGSRGRGPHETVPPRASWQCPFCKRTTWHPADVANHFCPCCGSEDRILPKQCEHFQ